MIRGLADRTRPPGKRHSLPVALNYDDYGNGNDVLLLVHGHPFDRTMWIPQAEFAARRGWRVIVPDLRGYGDSPLAGDENTLDLFAKDLAALLDECGVESAAIGGLSMGGQIAMAFCAEYPQRVRGLFLAATFESPETNEGRRTRELTAARLLSEGTTSYVSELLPRMLAPKTLKHNGAVTAHVRTMMKGTSARGAAAALRGRAKRPDYARTLMQFSSASLIVVGDRDEFTSLADAERMHRMLQDSELVIIEGAGHMPNLENPQATNKAIGRLLARVKATSGPGGQEQPPQDTLEHRGAIEE